MTQTILASASQIRADLLRNAGVQINVMNASVDETSIKAALLAEGVSPRDIADALAEAKAVKISRKASGTVIGADSVLELDGMLFDKPQSLSDARRHLEVLRGKTHRLHTAAVIASEGAPLWRHVATASLRMRNFSDGFLEAYLSQEGGPILHSVGAYRLEGLGAQLFTEIKGDYFSILGLPLLEILDFLRVRGALDS